MGRTPNVSSSLIINILTPPNLLPRPSSLNAPPTPTPHHPTAFRTPSRVPPERTPRRGIGSPSSIWTRTLSLVRIGTLCPRVRALAFRNLAHPPLLTMFLPVDHFLRLLPFLPEGRALSGYAAWAEGKGAAVVASGGGGGGILAFFPRGRGGFRVVVFVRGGTGQGGTHLFAQRGAS